MGRLRRLAGEQRWVLAAGTLLGLLGSALAYFGNPANTGICISCFLENAAGAVGLHANPRMQYLRPELVGFLLGSFGAAVGHGEFRARWRGAGLALVLSGVLMAVGSAIFIGCPIKALLRLAAGDLTALAGAAGLVGGVWLGLRLLPHSEGLFGGRLRSAPGWLPGAVVAAVAVLGLLLFVPGTLAESRVGGAAAHAPRWLSLAAGLLLGWVCQRSRFCVTGSVRDGWATGSAWPLTPLLAALLAAGLFNAFTGQFGLGYYDQPGAHLSWGWSFAGMALVGIVAVVAGGCPFRQIVKAGEGDLDAVTVCGGMVLGAALVQAWGLGANPGGVPTAGAVAVLVGLAGAFALGLVPREDSR